MDLERIQEVVRIFEASEVSEMELEEEGLRIRLKKQRPKTVAAATVPVGVPVPQPATVQTFIQEVSAEPPREKVAEDHEPDLPTINSPMVGTFYAAPAPGEPPFVRPGDTIEKDQTVCIVEAMKLMNEVTAKFSAVIEKVLVENAEPVEYGQPLFAVRPLE